MLLRKITVLQYLNYKEIKILIINTKFKIIGAAMPGCKLIMRIQNSKEKR